MSTIVLENSAKNGEKLKATFLSDKGMNLVSFKKGEVEVIDQSTRDLFEERFAGLGALIGPHFHRRKDEILPVIKDESLFPHIARVKAKGVKDPFSHGVARYAPWKAEATSDCVKASLSGKDLWNGVPLASLEGQNFNMTLEAKLKADGLSLSLSVVSDTASVVGIHYYYALPQKNGTVTSSVQDRMIIGGELKPIPHEWLVDSNQHLLFDLKNEADYTFHPHPNALKGTIVLDAGSYRLATSYESISGENCWQLFHPKDASFVCIEPISAKDPRHPNLTASSINIHLEIQ